MHGSCINCNRTIGKHTGYFCVTCFYEISKDDIMKAFYNWKQKQGEVK